MTSVADVPHDLQLVIDFAFRVLDWHEHLTEEEQPPRWMWWFEDDLEEWLDRVAKDRRERFGGPGSSGDRHTAPATGEELRNDLGAGRGRFRR